MKKALIVLFLTPFYLFSQPIRTVHTVVATSGDYSQNGPLSLSWTLGEIAAETVQIGGYTLTQGFQQPFEWDEIVPVIDLGDRTAAATIYPNPFKDVITIDFREAFPHIVTVSHAIGQVLMTLESGESRDRLDLSLLPPGVYVITIQTERLGPLQSCTLVKL